MHLRMIIILQDHTKVWMLENIDAENIDAWLHPVGWLVVGVKSDCLPRDLGLQVECPPWGSLYGIVARIYASFGENHGKLRTARSTSATEE